jgi:uncharacterized short protein YbdD (DUF466 family)
MKPLVLDEPKAARRGVMSTPGDAGPTRGLVFEKLLGIRQVCRQMFGIPDYERYLAHAATHHPDLPVLSRREFYARAIERKYGKSGPRCC